MTDLKAQILAAAEAGQLTLSHVEGGADFESVADWLDYEPTASDMENALVAAGLATIDWEAANEAYDRQRDAERARARFVGIKGA